jgi:cytidine deaminase
MTNEELINIAKNARKNAYAPNTGYTVGAALVAKSGTIYIGTNVEEYSILGLSNCAERVAIQNAYSYGEREFVAIAVVGGKDKEKEDETLMPCGVCLQYILDICKNIDIISYNKGKITVKKVNEFLNSPFILENRI